ncbi:IS3 family transposase, partial [Enterobacter asburiae]
GFAENTDDLFVGKTLLHGDVLMWLMKTLLTSGCTNQRGAGHHEWQSFLKSHGLEGSMSRRGNCHDNAVAESFFQLLKRERIKKKSYGTREEARSDIFDYIEMFYNSKRRHGSSDQMSPTEYENQYYQRLGSV